jgi:hypothetical protein
MLEFDFTKVEIMKTIKKKRNYLLFFMIIFYIIPICYVYKFNNNSSSVSNIICNKNNKNTIIFFMGCMGIATMLYEIERNDLVSTISILFLLLCIYGVLLNNEKSKLHYIFAMGAFINIFIFMTWQFYLTKYNIILGWCLLSCFCLLLLFIIKINKNLFYNEVLYIIIFAFYYMYLHYLTSSKFL